MKPIVLAINKHLETREDGMSLAYVGVISNENEWIYAKKLGAYLIEWPQYIKISTKMTKDTPYVCNILEMIMKSMMLI